MRAVRLVFFYRSSHATDSIISVVLELKALLQVANESNYINVIASLISV